MEKSKINYWAVFEKKEIKFEGTFTQCWEFLVKKYRDFPLFALVEAGIKIGRK